MSNNQWEVFFSSSERSGSVSGGGLCKSCGWTKSEHEGKKTRPLPRFFIFVRARFPSPTTSDNFWIFGRVKSRVFSQKNNGIVTTRARQAGERRTRTAVREARIESFGHTGPGCGDGGLRLVSRPSVQTLNSDCTGSLSLSLSLWREREREKLQSENPRECGRSS